MGISQNREGVQSTTEPQCLTKVSHEINVHLACKHFEKPLMFEEFMLLLMGKEASFMS